MDTVDGDKFVHDCARHIRLNEAKLGDLARASPSTWSSPASWMGLSTPTGSGVAKVIRPMPLTLTSHQIYYLLIRAEALGITVGQLDVRIPSASRPSSYFSFIPSSSAGSGQRRKDASDTMSVSSLRSTMSAISTFSISGAPSGWFGSDKPDPAREVKYVYSAMTKIPAIRIGAPPLKLIKDFEDCPGDSSVPLEVFKNLQSLELEDVDPRTFLGWDKLSFQLRSLTIRRSSVEDVTDVLVDAVLNDCKRRKGERIQQQRRKVHSPNSDDDASEERHFKLGDREGSPPPPDLPSLSWHFLRHLSLSDNNLTFVQTTPLHALQSLTSLDLSNNLLNAVPPSLSLLPHLQSLNLNNNLIDSVLGIPAALPSICALNLANNRLESLCGLERLPTLRRIDLRNNEILEAGEVGRLATLRHIDEIWVKNNPLFEDLEDARVDIYVEFAQEGKEVSTIRLDGDLPGYFERQRIVERVPSMTGRSRVRDGTPSAEDVTREYREDGRTGEPEGAQSAIVKAVRHRPQASHSRRIASKSTKIPQKDEQQGQHRDKVEQNARASNREEKVGAEGDIKRRNRRVVELEEGSSASNRVGPSSTTQEEVSDSDAIKKAALEGNTSLALGTLEVGTGVSEDDKGGVARTMPRQSAASSATNRPASTFSPTGSSMGRKAGAATAILTNVASNDRSSGGGNGLVSSGRGKTNEPSNSSAGDLQNLGSPAKENVQSRSMDESERFDGEGDGTLQQPLPTTFARGDCAEQPAAHQVVSRRANADKIKARRNETARTQSTFDSPSDVSFSKARGDDGKGKTTGESGGNDLRKKIEALKGEVGDDWLRLLSRGESVYVPSESEEGEER